MRKSPPTLVILDLNNSRTDPLGIVAAMKQDAALWPDRSSPPQWSCQKLLSIAG